MSRVFPRIATVGLTGLLIQFSDVMSEAANRAALAFRAAMTAQNWPEVAETSSTLTSAFVRFDPLTCSHDTMTARIAELLEARDWYQAALPEGRRHFRIPCVFGTDLAPQFDEAAELAGLGTQEALASLQAARPRVLTIGFAPGQPYTGELGPEWNIPRQSSLTPMVPAGALVIAIRQLIIFTGPAPTGWRHIGQTAFRNFRPEAESPFALTPGDELSFVAITPAELAAIERSDTSGNGGADVEVLS